MNLIRPAARAAFWRWREVLTAFVLALVGVWLMALGGYLLLPLGLILSGTAIGFGILAWRRMRFAQPGEAPGVVELDEGQVSYFGPSFGGALSLRELVELRVITHAGRRMWRLKQQDGQALLIPVEAMGAERLFDAFSALPGMDTRALVDALGPRTATPAHGQTLGLASDSRVIWRHPARAVLT